MGFGDMFTLPSLPHKTSATAVLEQAAARIEALATTPWLFRSEKTPEVDSPREENSTGDSTNQFEIRKKKIRLEGTNMNELYREHEQNLRVPKRPREENSTGDSTNQFEIRKKKIRLEGTNTHQLHREHEQKDGVHPESFSLVSGEQNSLHDFISNHQQKSRDARPLNQKPPENGSSPFLKAPPEIRLQIYQYLLPNGQNFLFNPSLSSLALTEKIRDKNFGLFQVSKLVDREASSVIYGQNFLRMHPQGETGLSKAHEVGRELALISDQNRRLIRNIEIHIGPLGYFDVAVKLYLKVTNLCPDLYRLYVLVHKTHWDHGTPLFPTKERLALGQIDSGLPFLKKLVIQTSHGHRQAIDLPVSKPPATP